MGEAKCMVGWPAGRPGFSKKRAAGGSAGLIRAALFFEKPGRPAGQLIILIILIILINQSILFLKPESNPFPETGVGGGVGGPLRVGGPFSMVNMVNIVIFCEQFYISQGPQGYPCINRLDLDPRRNRTPRIISPLNTDQLR